MSKKDAWAPVRALRFKQWLSDWDDYEFDAQAHRRKPAEHGYLFAMRASDLRLLSEPYTRRRKGKEVEGIQRERDVTRTGRIQRYVRYGYPYGDLKPAQRTDEALSLRKPGWLPTAIVINIRVSGDRRRNQTIEDRHLVRIRDAKGVVELVLPDRDALQGAEVTPFEVIDGQHRLWAFDDESGAEVIPDDFELPVVAFQGLDISWQAYLFWSINVSPKRINPSHAFDLYPLLRTEDWLQVTGELSIYREARAQELTEWMYTHEESPWAGRINMLGSKGSGVSQAAWVRSLLGSFLSTGQGSGRRGLFQSNLPTTGEPLGWTRPQQAAFMIQLWIGIFLGIDAQPEVPWIAKYLARDEVPQSARSCLLNQDMGVRAVHSVLNDLFYNNAEEWGLINWEFPTRDETNTTEADVEEARKHLKSHTDLNDIIEQVCFSVASFDWRSLEGPGVKESRETELEKRAYRGSGGYTILTRDVMAHVASSADGELAQAASALLPESQNE